MDGSNNSDHPDGQCMHVHNKEESKMMSKTLKRTVLFLNITLLILGEAGGPLLMRLYYLHGGKRIWLSGWLETGGWPALFVPLLISYMYRRRRSKGGEHVKLFFMKPGLFAACSFLGLLTGLVDYFYAFGISRLPVSTSALIYATQIAFTAVFSFLLVKQQLTAYSINSVVLLIIGAVVLGVHAAGDRRADESNTQYYLGFFMMVAASLLYGFVLPLIELTYKRAKQTITYSLVIEMQIVMSIFATAFCTIGMIFNNDFKVIPREAREYDLHQGIYFTVLAVTAIVWQCFYLGAVGVIFYGSSLLTGIIIASLLPVTELLAVVLYHEKFTVEKGISLALCLWGFTSYFYGEHRQSKKINAEIREEPYDII